MATNYLDLSKKQFPFFSLAIANIRNVANLTQNCTFLFFFKIEKSCNSGKFCPPPKNIGGVYLAGLDGFRVANIRE